MGFGNDFVEKGRVMRVGLDVLERDPRTGLLDPIQNRVDIASTGDRSTVLERRRLRRAWLNESALLGWHQITRQLGQSWQLHQRMLVEVVLQRPHPKTGKTRRIDCLDGVRVRGPLSGKVIVRRCARARQKSHVVLSRSRFGKLRLRSIH